MTSIRNQLHEKERELDRTRQRERESRAYANQLWLEIQTNRQKVRRLHQQHDRTRETLAQVQERTKAQVHELQQALSLSQQNYQKTTELLETRTTELRQAQTYLSSVDDITDTEVIHIIDTLNVNIHSVSARITDHFQSRIGGAEYSLQMKDQVITLLESSRVLGRDLLNGLRSPGDYKEVHQGAVVQTSLQSLIVAFATSWCEMWRVKGHPESEQNLLRSGYEHMMANEPRSVSGKWRALSHTYIQPCCAVNHDASQALAAAEHDLLDRSAMILTLCGVSDSLHPLAVKAELREVAHTEFQEIAQLARRFCQVTHRRVLSRDFHVEAVPPGRPFDPSLMKLEDIGRPVAKDASVIGTIQMGLRRVEVLHSASGFRVGEEDRVKDAAGRLKTVMLREPIVVVNTMLEELRK